MTAAIQFQDFMFKGIPQSFQPKPEPPLDPPEDVNLDHYGYGKLAESEVRFALNKHSEPGFLIGIDWNLDDIELSPERNFVIAQLVLQVKIPLGALYE